MPLLNFNDMATLASDTPPMSPPFHRRRKSWARKVERVCCNTLSYFPLLFVYGLTTWSVWVAVNVSFFSGNNALAYLKAGASILLYALADVSYTIAVFTDPGSPLDPRTDAVGRRKGGGYEGLPTYEDEEEPHIPEGMSTVTAKQSGKPRYCKKCRSVKPDRSHHCSTCGKCVLKMDHHCPWLATCAGLRNYKPFLLFLVYTSIFCWMCFGVSAWWVYMEIADQAQMEEGMRVVNTVLLAVLGGVVGIVLSGFTAWHIYLTATGQTTIESLEKTRYLSPLRKNMEHQLQAHSNRNYVGDESNNPDSSSGLEEQTLTEHLKEIHANALPGVLRPEEGEENSASPSPQPPFQRSSPAQSHLRQSYASMEAQREHDRYAAYLDEQDSEKLPNAFDLGWRRNLLHVFGESPLLWFLPVCNSTGDGWMWEVSPKWTNARTEIANERLRWQSQQQQQQQSQRTPSFEPPANRDWKWTPGGFVDRPRPAPPRVSGHSTDGMGSEMQPIGRRKVSGDANEYDTSSDEDTPKRGGSRPLSGAASTSNWNDIPDDFLSAKGKGNERMRSASRGRRKGD